MNRKSIFHIAFDAMFLALFVVFSYIPYIGYINIGPIAFTTMHILVLIGALLFGKWKGALFGLFMGVLSLLVSLQYPGTINYLFLNPFVSVLPRVIFGFVSGLIFDILRKKSTFAGFLTVSAPLCGILTIFHTAITLLCLYVFGYLDIFYIYHLMGLEEIIISFENLFSSFGNFVVAFIAPGSVCEVAAAIILAPTIMSVLYKFVIKKSGAIYKLDVNFAQDENGVLSKKKLIVITTILGIIVVILATLVLILFYYFNK